MNWIIARLKEKSTWLALFTFASLFGMQIEPEMKDKLIEAIIAVAAVLAFVFKEKVDDLPASDQTNQRTELPPIELQSQPDSANHRRLADPTNDLASGRRVDSAAGNSTYESLGGVRATLQAPSQPESFGFNDR